MASIKLCSDFPYRDISVPSKFIDEYMPEANGEFVKIYLYLLRSLGSSSSDCSISKIADKFDHTEKDVLRALKYWERQKLLALDYNPDKSIAGIHVTDIYHLDDDYSSNRQADAIVNPAVTYNTVTNIEVANNEVANNDLTN